MIGKSRESCPYPRNTWSGEEWVAGWFMAWAINESIVRNGGEDGREAWKRMQCELKMAATKK